MQVTERFQPKTLIQAGRLPGETRRFYIYLTGGEAQESEPATAIHFTPDRVMILLGETPVATYHRDDVYFIALRQVPPPPVG